MKKHSLRGWVGKKRRTVFVLRGFGRWAGEKKAACLALGKESAGRANVPRGTMGWAARNRYKDAQCGEGAGKEGEHLRAAKGANSGGRKNRVGEGGRAN